MFFRSCFARDDGAHGHVHHPPAACDTSPDAPHQLLLLRRVAPPGLAALRPGRVQQRADEVEGLAGLGKEKQIF